MGRQMISLMSRKPWKCPTWAVLLAKPVQGQEGLCAGETLRCRDTGGGSLLTRLLQGRMLSKGAPGVGVRGNALFC